MPYDMIVCVCMCVMCIECLYLCECGVSDRTHFHSNGAELGVLSHSKAVNIFLEGNADTDAKVSHILITLRILL